MSSCTARPSRQIGFGWQSIVDGFGRGHQSAGVTMFLQSVYDGTASWIGPTDSPEFGTVNGGNVANGKIADKINLDHRGYRHAGNPCCDCHSLKY